MEPCHLIQSWPRYTCIKTRSCLKKPTRTSVGQESQQVHKILSHSHGLREDQIISIMAEPCHRQLEIGSKDGGMINPSSPSGATGVSPGRVVLVTAPRTSNLLSHLYSQWIPHLPQGSTASMVGGASGGWINPPLCPRIQTIGKKKCRVYSLNLQSQRVHNNWTI